MNSAVLLVSHGTVDDLDDLQTFVTNVRRGHPPPPELIVELRRRYQAIGGRSPLNSINAELARKLELRLGQRVAWANRLFKPYTREVLTALARDGIRRVALVPLAQHSAAIYTADASRAAADVEIALTSAPDWGQNDELCAAFGARIVHALAGAPVDRTVVVMTAHSLPKSIVDAGDPYEREVRLAAAKIAGALELRLGRALRIVVAFPLTRISPASIGSTPKRARQSSVRPAPISPAIPVISPRRRVNETSLM